MELNTVIGKDELIMLAVISGTETLETKHGIKKGFEAFIKRHNIPNREIKKLESNDRLWRSVQKFRDLELVEKDSVTITRKGRSLLKEIGEDPHHWCQEIPVIDGEISLEKQGRFTDVRGNITL